MKKRYFALGASIIAVAAIIGAYGTYLKFNVLKPLGIYQDQSIFALPFLMHSDKYLQFMVEHADQMLQPSTPPTGSTAPSESTTKPTDPTNSTNGSSATTLPSTSQGGTDGSSTSETNPSKPSSSTTEPTAPTTTAPIGYPDFAFPAGVGDDWYDNTLFIGDSRVVSLRDYVRSGNADYFCDVGMNLLNCSEKVLSDRSFSNKTLDALLSERQYDKIIVNLGLNECGFYGPSFQMLYRDFVGMLKQKQPNAVIILQGIMSVTKSKADSASYYQPSFIAERSAFIASLADGVRVHYVDCNPYFTDENGYLFSSLTNDGYHLTVTGCKHWRNWMHYAFAQLGV